MESKKIILFIVEGISEENALGPILDKLVTDSKVKFKVINGDVTSNYSTRVETIENVIENKIKSFLNNIFKPSDIKKIIHITDTDGTFIDHNNIKEKKFGTIEYFDDKIVTSNKYHIVKRNDLKSEVLNHLNKLDEIKVNNTNIPYQIYYMSCNLDHVLYNERNLKRRDKIDKALDFSESYYNKEVAFIDFMNQKDILLGSNYRESWQLIEVNNNSLNRSSNLSFFLNQYKKIETVV